MTIEWMQYPVSLGSEDETMTITWSDGSTDVIPAHDGAGETLFQLPRLMNEIFKVENFNCFEGQSGQFIDEYPTLFRSDTGVLVLRAESAESFMNAFICKSRDAAECLLSWMSGDIEQWIDQNETSTEGALDFHWVSVREVLGFIGAGLLNEIPPIVFDLDDEPASDSESMESLGLVKVELPWWNPPVRRGPSFAYPASMFIPETYELKPTLENFENPSVAISVSQCLSDDEWTRLLQGSLKDSIASRILEQTELYNNFEQLVNVTGELGDQLMQRWLRSTNS